MAYCRLSDILNKLFILVYEVEFKDVFYNFTGYFNLPLSSMGDCKGEWLDRPLYPKYVEKLVNAGRSDVTAFTNMQPWLVIANIAKSEFTSKDMMKGCTFQVIGGRHRMHAFKEVSFQVFPRKYCLLFLDLVS